VFCRILLEELDRLPGDSRTQIGFIAFDSLLYFYGLDPSFPQPKMFIISDLDGNSFPNDQLLCSVLSEERIVSFIFLYAHLSYVVCSLCQNVLITFMMGKKDS